MTRHAWTAAFALGLCALVAAPALARNAPPKVPTKLRAQTSNGAPTAAKDASTVSMLVTNSRKTDLVQLQAAESGSASWKKVLGALKAGKQAQAQLPHPFNCRVDLHGTFSDGQSLEASDVDVCTQKTLNLTD